MKKILALVLALAMILMVGAAFAATSTPSITIDPANDSEATKNVAIDYVAYRIMEADIEKDPVVDGDTGNTTAEGTVAYYVTTEDRANQLKATNLFNVTKVGDTNKWYVELKDKNTSAQALVDAFSASSFDLTKFDSVSFSKAAGDDSAASGTVAAGYYYITSTLGSKIALQTLTNVSIKEKNDYTTDDKTIPDVDKNSQIGQEITYDLIVNVPVTATEQIVLTDTMSKGLTFKRIESQSPIEGTVSEVTSADGGATKFTITYTADQIKNLVKDKTETQTITVKVVVIVNDEAAIETDIPNTLDLKYGNVYDAAPKTVNTKTYKFEFDKVDGSNTETKLTGAEFQFKLGDNALKLVKVTEGVEYRIATEAEIAAAAETLTDTIVTNGNTITIKGLDADVTYSLVETKEPTGYNKLEDPIEVKATTDDDGNKVFVHKNVLNNKGTTLPSTGGIGTTIFYILGGLLVVGAAVILVARRKAQD